MTMIRERSTSVDSDEWSDPRDGFLSLGAPSFPDVEELGILIPDFLQPLLGLDFVPYLPSSTATTEGPTSLDSSELGSPPQQSSLCGDENDNRNATFHNSGNTKKVDSEIQSPESQSEAKSQEQSLQRQRTQDEEDNAFMEEVLSSLRPQSLPGGNDTSTRAAPGESSQEISPRKTNRRSKGGSIIKRVRSKLGDRRSSRRDRRRSRSDVGNDENRSANKNGKGQRASNPLEWFRDQRARLETHQSQLRSVQSEARVVEARTAEIQKRIDLAHNEVVNLQNALTLAEQRLSQDLDDFEKAKAALLQLEDKALKASQAVVDSIQKMKRGPESNSESDSNPSDVIEVNLEGRAEQTSPDEPLQMPFQKSVPLKKSTSRQRASTAPPSTRVDSFIRVNDLNLFGGGCDSMSRDSSQSSISFNTNANKSTNGFIFVDSNMSPILENLARLGYEIATDESERFVPTSDTQRLLSKFENSPMDDNSLQDWPIRDWNLAHGNEVLVWTGDIGHNGFGSNWPVVKGRTLVETSPRALVEFMMDSSRIKEYSKMSQGRSDLVRIQRGLDVTTEKSFYGFPGDCKIVRSLNKPRFFPTTIETLSLYYSKPLETSPGSYMTVIRSVFEDDSGVHKSRSANTIRSEMLLGVLLFRPANKDHTVTEFTTITHVFSPGVPEMLARRVAPSSAYSMMKDVQSVFKKA